MLSLDLKLALFLCGLFVLDANGQTIEIFSTDSDLYLNTTELLSARGFESEIHHPITQDGYILQLIRIVNPYMKNKQSRLRPFYMQHGLFGNSDNFLLGNHGRLISGSYIQLPDLSVTDCTGVNAGNVSMTLALALATCGYDVWLGNFRGNHYSTGHILLDPRIDSKYWSFSLDELSAYDLTANIEYILARTEFGELGYVGHSLGTSSMFQLLSDRPNYSRFIKPYIALAPVAHVANIEAVIAQIGAHTPAVVAYLGASESPFFGITSDLLLIIDKFVGTFICGNSFLKDFCILFLFIFAGFDPANLDKDVIPVFYSHFPDGTSTRVLAHFAQRVKENTFSYYDFGAEENKNLYNSPIPPAYNLSEINLKYMILISGINDFLADPTDVSILRSQLTVRPYIDYVLPFEPTNHVDFLIGLNVGEIQNSHILQWLKRIYNE